MAEQEVISKIVELNNKSRKGSYLYIKVPGQRGRYFKRSPERDDEELVLYAINEKKPVAGVKTINQFLVRQGLRTPKVGKITKKNLLKRTEEQKRIKGKRSVYDELKRGPITVETTLKGADAAKIKHELVKQLLPNGSTEKKDELERNFHKLKNRIEYHVEATDERGNGLGSFSDYSKKDLETALRDYKRQFAALESNNVYLDQYGKEWTRIEDNLKVKVQKGESGAIKKVMVKIVVRN